MHPFAAQIWRALAGRWREAQWLAAWAPTLAVPLTVAPTMALGALLALVLVSGVAVLSLATLLVALLTAHLLLEQVFGVSIVVP